MSADLTRYLTYLSWAALIWVALALAVGAARDRVNQSPVGPRRALLTYDDAVDPVRVEQMTAIRDAEEAWDRDVWGRA